MGKRRHNGAKRRARPAGASSAAASGVLLAPAPAGPFDAGVGLFARRALSWAVDYLVCAGLVSVFYWCANVFYLDASTVSQGHLMLVCAVVTVLMLTVYLPASTGGQSLGERACRLRVESLRGGERTYLQCFVYECVLKVVLGPFLAAFCLLDYVVLGCLVHRDPDHQLIVDFFTKTRVRPVARAAHGKPA